METITNRSYIKAWSVVALINKLREIHPGEKISIILDNARYQRCHLVQSAANMYNIDLIYLPTYSPNLNLIERCWKYVKGKALENQNFKDFKNFQESIMDCIDSFSGKHKKDLETLLTWNFQAF